MIFTVYCQNVYSPMLNVIGINIPPTEVQSCIS